MITLFLLTAFASILSVMFFWLPEVEQLPLGAQAIFDQLPIILTNLNVFFPIDVLLVIIGLWLSMETFSFLFRGLDWFTKRTLFR